MRAGSSTGKPGTTPDATWESGIVDGHPVTIGLVPSPARHVSVAFSDGGSYGTAFEELNSTGFTMFAVDYSTSNASQKEPARPSEIASIRWTGATGIVDGIEGDHRLRGRTLSLSKTLSVEVVLRPADSGRTTVLGNAFFTHEDGATTGTGLPASDTDAAGVAVVTVRQPVVRTTAARGVRTLFDGAPIAAGILPPGASGIGWILSTGADSSPVVVSERMPDGTVIFAMKVPSAQESSLVKATVKAVTWTNADGSHGTATATPRPSTSPATTTASAPTATAPTSTAPTSGLPGTPACQFGVPGAKVPGLRPALIFIGCATSANNLQHISWSTWTATGATGSATHGINDCKPSCAQGTYTYFPVNVRLSNPGRLNGMLVFKTIAMSPTSKVGRPETATEHDPPNGIWGWSCSSAASLCSPR